MMSTSPNETATKAKSVGSKGFARVIGQSDTIRRLKAFAELYRSKEKTIGHILLVGADGSGKRTIVNALAQEYGLNLRETAGGAFDRASDLAAAINDLDRDAILFLRDINKLRKPLVEILIPALQDFELNIVVGRGPEARFMRLAVKPFTCVATVEKEADCPPEIRDSFSLALYLQRYSEAELGRLATALALEKGFSVENAAVDLIVRLSEGNPGRIEKIVRHLALIGKSPIALKDAEETLSVLGYKTFQSAQNEPSDLNELSGTDFERLIATLLQTLGFQTEMTRATGDGGIDIEASLDRPVVGGRYLIQCKRFAPDLLVGSPTVREFYGALVADRKAIKGILITTSGFTAQAREFAESLPLELIDGQQLGQMLAECRNRKPPESL